MMTFVPWVGDSGGIVKDSSEKVSERTGAVTQRRDEGGLGGALLEGREERIILRI